MSHTPTPWRVVDEGGPVVRGTSAVADIDFVADCRLTVDAILIVQACNQHEQLKADLSQQDAQMKLLLEMHANERAVWHEQKTRLVEALELTIAACRRQLSMTGKGIEPSERLQGAFESAEALIAKYK